MMNRFLATLGIGLSFFTPGVIVGLGFIAAATKFQAVRPGLLELLDVGYRQFGALHRLETVLVPAACLTILLAIPKLWAIVLASGATYAYQALVIAPALNARMVAWLEGQPVPPSSLHQTYVYVAGGLVLLLLGQGWLGVRQLARAESPQPERLATATPSFTQP